MNLYKTEKQKKMWKTMTKTTKRFNPSTRNSNRNEMLQRGGRNSELTSVKTITHPSTCRGALENTSIHEDIRNINTSKTCSKELKKITEFEDYTSKRTTCLVPMSDMKHKKERSTQGTRKYSYFRGLSGQAGNDE
ncbi:hypothetical protein RUM43_007817 [Polyplax serrata]|uniref:Uncharacterized protein n=1 Tax=Polyplax serrata TaxID=468196 RepID=A0AAN8S8T9_POLSC